MTLRDARERVLVTDGETRAVVAACRGLAAAGFRVSVVAGARPAPAHWSRSCRERLDLPHPLEDSEGFLEGIERVASIGTYAVLVPGSDAALLALSRGRDRIEPHVSMGLPSHEAVVASLSKLALADAAAEVGLSTPETAVCDGVEEALSAARGLGFPVILKPVSSLIEVAGVPMRVGSVLVDSPQTLAGLLPAYGTPCLIQRSHVGRIVSFAGVLAAGRLLGVAMSRYLRTWYPKAGNACFSQSADAPPGLCERLRALLAALGWEGIFEFELIEHPDGSFAAIDLNPRVYGSLALAVAAGANLPALWCAWLLGREARPAAARRGVSYRWEDADLRHLGWSLRRGELRAAAAIVRPRRGTVHPHFATADPGPLLARAHWLARAVIRTSHPAPRATAEPEPRDHSPPDRARTPGDVAVIGAGPYGLAAAAHLRQAGVPVRVFGEPLEFWRSRMPDGMILRSRKRSSHIADPDQRLTIDAFEAETGRTVTKPSLTLDEFVEYGLWFQRRAVPDVDPRKVRLLERGDGEFRLELEDGEEIIARRAVVAAGLFPFGRLPQPFRSLPPALVSHSADHRDLSAFAERKVLVVGGGQGALESAARRDGAPRYRTSSGCCRAR